MTITLLADSVKNKKQSKILNTFYDPVDVTDDIRISFPHGLIGLEELTEFYIMQREGSDLFLLHSSNLTSKIRGEPYFFMMDIQQRFPTYKLNISKSAYFILNTEKKQELLVYGILNMNNGLKGVYNATVNLMAPVLINPNEKIGLQTISFDKDYKAQHPVIIR